MATIMRSIAELVSRWETIRFLVTSNLKAGHREKVLGHLWNLLDPLLFVAVYYVVFGLLFKQAERGQGTFVVYLAVGVLAWRFFDATVSQATLCIRANRGLIHEIRFPKAVFPVSVSLSRLYDFLWGLAVLLGIVLCTGFPLTAHVLWLLPLLVLNLVFAMGIAFFAAYLGAFFADTTNVAGVLLRLWMYASPTFYYARGEHALIPERFQGIYMMNPMACVLEGYRDALLWGRAPDPAMLLYMLAVSVTVLLAGFAVFTFGEGRFAKYI